MAYDTVEMFVYTGVGEGAVAPKGIVRVRVDPSVLAIPHKAFSYRRQLQEVELHYSLREIGGHAFYRCTALNKVQLSDGVESIGNYAFQCCNFTKFRNPPLITTIPFGMLGNCRRIFSLELPEHIIEVKQYAFVCCHSLRNVALASNTAVERGAFKDCTDLLHIFGMVEAIVNALKIRFDELPVHSSIYFKSY